jgi:DNA-binding transcriptional MocR family regulator
VFLDLHGVLRGRPLDELLEKCVERGLLLAPGAAFGSAYAEWARICFTASPEDHLVRAVTIFNEVVASF